MGKSYLVGSGGLWLSELSNFSGRHPIRRRRRSGARPAPLLHERRKRSHITLSLYLLSSLSKVCFVAVFAVSSSAAASSLSKVCFVAVFAAAVSSSAAASSLSKVCFVAKFAVPLLACEQAPKENGDRSEPRRA